MTKITLLPKPSYSLHKRYLQEHPIPNLKL